MMPLRRILARLGNLFRNNRAEQELAREVASHLALMADDFERRGMPREEAQMAAKHAYGGVEQVKQAHRNERSLLWLEHTIQDLRHAVRALARSPIFTLVAIVTIALGVGINTTLFTAYDAVALKTLPVANASSVVRLRRTLESHIIGDPQYAFSYPEYGQPSRSSECTSRRDCRKLAGAGSCRCARCAWQRNPVPYRGGGDWFPQLLW